MSRGKDVLDAGRSPIGGCARRFLFAALCFAPLLPSAAHQDLIAFVAGKDHVTSVYLIEPGVDGARPTALAPCVSSAQPKWSIGSNLLTFETPREGGGTQVAWHAWDADGSVASGVCGTRFQFNRNPAPIRDGRYLAYEGYDDLPQESALVVFDRDTGEETVWGGERRALFTPAWLPNPKLMLSLNPDQEISIPGVDIDVMREESGLASGDALQGGPTLALLCIGLDAGKPGLTTELLLATKTQTLPVLAVVPDGPDSIRYSEWKPSVSVGGTRIVFESDYGGDREIYQLNQSGLLNLSNHHAADWNPAWAKNDRWLAFESFRDGSRQLYRVMVESARVLPLKGVDNAEHWSASWAPNSKSLVCVSGAVGDSRLVIFDVEEGSMRALPVVEGQSSWAPAWRPKR